MNFSRIVDHIWNLKSWHTNRRIVVIESDDWGSIRMGNSESISRLEGFGIDLTSGNGQRFNYYDHLASYSDLSRLFEVLSSVQDKYSRPAVITAMSIMANPDFDKIRDNGFNRYYYKRFTDSLSETYGCERSLELWQLGEGERLFVPEFHGREHLNVQVWMRDLQDGNTKVLEAFRNSFYGFRNWNKNFSHTPAYQAAFDPVQIEEVLEHCKILEDGVDIFKSVFSRNPKYFVPPNSIVHPRVLERCKSLNIDLIGRSRRNKIPYGNGRYKTKYHFLGQRNDLRQRIIIRNCFFEPNVPNRDWVSECLKEVQKAFNSKLPAIIGNHRTCFISRHCIGNRDTSLRKLGQLLSGIVKKWPDVEFMTSSELGKLMNVVE